MHKGYAFVQFTNPFDARSACLGEDGRTVLSQILGKYPLKKRPYNLVGKCSAFYTTNLTEGNRKLIGSDKVV